MKDNEKNQKPHAVYVVEGEGDKAYSTKIGAAWPNQDGKGFNIQLTCLPLNGRLVVREPKSRGGGAMSPAASRRPRNAVVHGDCIAVMGTMEPASVDFILN